MEKQQPSGCHHSSWHRQRPLPSFRLGRLDLINKCIWNAPRVPCTGQELNVRSLENDSEWLRAPLIHDLQLHRYWLGCQDLQRFSRHAREVSSTLLLSIQQQTHLHSNRHSRSAEESEQDLAGLTLHHDYWWPLGQYWGIRESYLFEYLVLGWRSKRSLEGWSKEVIR